MSAQWVVWEAGQSFTNGKAVISSGGDPQADGVAQLFHFHQVNFEAVIKWRPGDTLEVSSADQDVLLYTLGEPAASVSVELFLSHSFGAGNLEKVSGEPQAVDASVLCGNTDSVSEPIRFRIQLFRNDEEIGYNDLPGGIDYDLAPGLTFAHRPEIPLLENASAANYLVGESGAVSEPLKSESYLSVASFGEGSPSWDRIVLTLSGEGTEMAAGTRFRFLIAGAPLARSPHRIPCSSDRLPPIVVHSDSEEISVPLTGLHYGDADMGRFDFFTPERKSALVYANQEEAFTKGRADLKLRLSSGSGGSGDLLIGLESDDCENLQATTIYRFNEYRLRPLDDLLSSAWAREPGEWESERPLDRPLWESSIPLSDKLEGNEAGIALAYAGGSFEARQLTVRRTMVGAVKLESASASLPGIWKQFQTTPEKLSDSPGAAGCANGRIGSIIGGFLNVETGTRPCLWIQNKESGWDELRLKTKAFTSDGSVLTVNDRGIAGGYMEVFLGEQPTRLPCLWLPGESRTYRETPVVLPVSDSALGAAVLDINAAGQAVGYYVDQAGRRHACRWEVDPAKFIDLETKGVATSINSVGIAVGHGEEGCFLWQGEQRLALSEIPGAIDLVSVSGISAFGDLVGRDRYDQRVIAEPVSLLRW